MSLEAMVWALKLKAGLDPLGKLVLLGIANHADSFGNAAYPSRKTLAEYCDCSIRSVQRKLNELVAAGIIAEGDQRIVQHIRSDRRPVVYDLVTDGLFASPLGSRGDRLSPRQPVDNSPSRGDTVSPRDAHGVTGRVERGDTVGTQTVLEPIPPLPPVSGCSRHAAHDERCRACRSVRASEDQAEQRRRQAADRAAHNRMAQAEIDRCGMCNARGYLMTGALCNHDPHSAEKARRGADKVRRAMGIKDADKESA